MAAAASTSSISRSTRRRGRAVEAELRHGASSQRLDAIGVRTHSIERYVFVDPADPADGICHRGAAGGGRPLGDRLTGRLEERRPAGTDRIARARSSTAVRA